MKVDGGAESENPVMKLAAAGLTPILPVIAELGTDEIADCASTAKFSANPKFTGAGPTPKPPKPVPAPGATVSGRGVALMLGLQPKPTKVRESEINRNIFFRVFKRILFND